MLTDAVGAARVVLDPVSGDSLWTWEGREAFGHAAPNPQPTANHAAFTFHARFPGQWFDPETGLHHNGFRDYDARTGRYVQSDPIGLEAGWNTYGYVGGDPVGAFDPLGLKVYLAFHQVKVFGLNTYQYHGKIIITGNNNDKRVTFGGGPDGKLGPLGALWGGVDRDYDQRKENLLQYDITGLACFDEDALIQSLTNMVKRYNENHSSFWTGYSYSFAPGSKLAGQNDYNSNSFIHGLGLAAGLNMPDISVIPISVPGYDKPLPVESFR